MSNTEAERLAQIVAIFGPDKLNATTVTANRESGYSRAAAQPPVVSATELTVENFTTLLKMR